MNEMIERMARGKYERWKQNPVARKMWPPVRDGIGFDGLDPNLQEHFRHEAREDIATMREPTETMVKAGNSITVYGDDMAGELGYVGDSGEVYQAMIDEALK